MRTYKMLKLILNQNGGAKADTLVKLVLIFFISLLSFSVGTFVGKQFSDSEHKMAALEGGENHVERHTASVPPDATEVNPSEALTEEDISSLEEEFTEHKIVNDHHQEGHTTAAHDSEEAHHAAPTKEDHHAVAKNDEHAKDTHHSAKDNIEHVAANVAHGEAPTEHTPTEHKARKPSSTILPSQVASDTVGKYTVQVSSHNNEADAAEHARALKEKGFSAFYVSANIKGKTWYRVNIGLYSSAKEANQQKENIVSNSSVKSALVQKIRN